MEENNWLARAERIYGKEGIGRLAKARVIVFGIGGVGGHAAEALARGGVGQLTLVDGDTVGETNLNRQLVATRRALGRMKVDAMKERLEDAAPGIRLEAVPRFLTEENADDFHIEEYDFVLDCVDQITAKVAIARRAKEQGVPMIAAMGAGMKRHPEMFEIADIEKTSVCPLARVMRKKYREAGLNGIPVVYSKEEPMNDGIRTPGSTSFTPGVMGMIMAGYAINCLSGKE